MIARVLSIFFVMLAIVGCRSSHNVDYFPYTDEGVLKPRVAIASVTDSSGISYPWDVSDEIVHGIRFHLRNDGKLYVLPQSEVNESLAMLGNEDYLGSNLAQWKSFCKADYVVMIDIFDRKELPFEKGKFYPLFPTTGHHSSTVLALKARVKVVDIRGNQPKTVLYEVMESNHLLPWGYDDVDYAEASWGEENYKHTPIGCVHTRLIYQQSQRLKMVIGDV